MKMKSHTRAIDKISRRRDRYEIPDWQREEVWSDDRKKALIDSILRGWKLPKFYFVKLNDDEFEVLDGQQRLTTIYEFFDDELSLSKDSAKLFGGEKYSKLPQSVADTFDDFEIEFDLIEDAEEKDLKAFFQRLQQGLPLTSSEKLNSVHSKLRDFCRELSKHEFFSKKVRASNKRYGHFDILAKSSVIEIEGLDTGLRYDDLVKVFEEQKAFSSSSSAAKRIKAAVEYLNRSFSKERDPALKNRTIVQSMVTLACKIVSSKSHAGTEKMFHKFVEHFSAELSRQVELGQDATDSDYIEFQRTVNANVKGSAEKRQKILLRKLLSYGPTFMAVFGPGVVADSGIESQIKVRAKSILDLVTEINSAYSGSSGEDLFKATNKTAKALVAIGKPAKDVKAYQSLVDDLYFLFKESPGHRLGDNSPESFMDINILRTDLRHDVDHGEEKKVRAKKKKHSEVFEKHGGAGVPATVDPERFVLVHANLLGAIEKDLQAVLKKYAA